MLPKQLQNAREEKKKKEERKRIGRHRPLFVIAEDVARESPSFVQLSVHEKRTYVFGLRFLVTAKKMT